MIVTQTTQDNYTNLRMKEDNCEPLELTTDKCRVNGFICNENRYVLPLIVKKGTNDYNAIHKQETAMKKYLKENFPDVELSPMLNKINGSKDTYTVFCRVNNYGKETPSVIAFDDANVRLPANQLDELIGLPMEVRCILDLSKASVELTKKTCYYSPIIQQFKFRRLRTCRNLEL